MGNENHYPLQLANGQGWNIVATDGVEPWVERLAAIMELTPAAPNNHPRLIISDRDPDSSPHLQESPPPCIGANNLPRSGWVLQDLKWLEVWSHPSVQDIICKFGIHDTPKIDFVRMWQTLNPIYQRALDDFGLPFHAGLVEFNGKGALICGSGDTGKSTTCRRLPPPWRVLCDDETLVVRNHQGQYLAHPFPTWSDYLHRRSERTWNVQRPIPLAAIFSLEQAEADEVVPIGPGQAAIHINQSAADILQRDWRLLDKEAERRQKGKTFANACALAGKIPSYTLRVSLTGEFWVEIEKVLSQ